MLLCLRFSKLASAARSHFESHHWLRPLPGYLDNTLSLFQERRVELRQPVERTFTFSH